MSTAQSSRKPRILTAEQRERKRLYLRVYRAAHPDKVHAWAAAGRAKHPEKARARCKAWRDAHPEEVEAYRVAYYAAHREELLADLAVWGAANREVRRARFAAWYAAHPEANRARGQAYRAAHPEEVRAACAAWATAHPEEVRANNARRRARERGAPVNDFTAAQWLEMQTAYDHRCVYCGKRRKGTLTKDHITPLIDGGSHTAHNIVPACKSCNSRKGPRAAPMPVQPVLLLIADGQCAGVRGQEPTLTGNAAQSE